MIFIFHFIKLIFCDTILQMAYTTYKGKRSVKRKIGFRARSATPGGRDVLNRRRAKGRAVLAYNKPVK